MLVAGSVLDSTEIGQETRMEELREEIEQGSYQVDAKAVADAMLRRLSGLRKMSPAPAPSWAAFRIQNECS